MQVVVHGGVDGWSAIHWSSNSSHNRICNNTPREHRMRMSGTRKPGKKSEAAYQELYKIVVLRSFRSSWKVHWKKAIKRVFPRNLWGGYEGRRRRTRTQKNRLETAVLPRAFRRGEMARGSRTGQIYDRYTGHGQRATFTPAAITRHYRD